MRSDGIERQQTAGNPARRMGALARLWDGGKLAATAIGLFAGVFVLAAVPVLLLAAVVGIVIAAARVKAGRARLE